MSYSGNWQADQAEREYEREALLPESFFYDCPECGASVEVGSDEAEVTCPSCHTELVVDPDADFRESGWIDQTRLIPKHGGTGAGMLSREEEEG